MREVHGNTEFDRLLEGRSFLQQAVRDRHGTLRQLVGQHFDRFVDAKVAIDRVHADMRERGLAQSEGMRKSQEAVMALSEKAQTLFKPLLTRQEHESLIKRRLAFIQRHELIFSLPARLLSAIQQYHPDHAALIADYRRAKSLYSANPVLQQVWRHQVEPAKEQMQQRMLQYLADPQQPIQDQLRMVEYLRSIDCQPDPMDLLIQHRRDHLFALLQERVAVEPVDDDGFGDCLRLLHPQQSLTTGIVAVSQATLWDQACVMLEGTAVLSRSKERLQHLQYICQQLQTLLPAWSLLLPLPKSPLNVELANALRSLIEYPDDTPAPLLAAMMPQLLAQVDGICFHDCAMSMHRDLISFLRNRMLQDAHRLPSHLTWNGQSEVAQESLNFLTRLIGMGQEHFFDDGDFEGAMQEAFQRGLRSLLTQSVDDDDKVWSEIALRNETGALPLTALSTGNRHLFLLSILLRTTGLPLNDEAVLKAFLEPRLGQLVSLIPSTKAPSDLDARPWIHQLLLRLVSIQAQIIEIDMKLLRPLMEPLLRHLLPRLSETSTVERVFIQTCLQTIVSVGEVTKVEGEARERVQALLNAHSLDYACFQYT